MKLEDCPKKSIVNSTKSLAQISDVSQDSIVESSSVFRSEVGNISSMDEIVDSFGRNSSIIEDASVEYGVLNVQTGRDQIDLSNAEEPLLHQVYLILIVRVYTGIVIINHITFCNSLLKNWFLEMQRFAFLQLLLLIMQ